MTIRTLLGSFLDTGILELAIALIIFYFLNSIFSDWWTGEENWSLWDEWMFRLEKRFPKTWEILNRSYFLPFDPSRRG